MIENYKDFKKQIQSFPVKPRLLLHSCCAPCSTHVLTVLLPYFDITIFYSNDNIFPEREYIARFEEVKRFCAEFNPAIPVISDEYRAEDYYECVRGLENLGEKSMRCYECYLLRLEKTAIKAQAEGFDFFTTTLSISPHKNEKWINKIGYQLEKKYQVKYLYSNFKKENGYQHSVELAKMYHLYRQDYCGCVFSLEERRSRDDGTSKEDKD